MGTDTLKMHNLLSASADEKADPAWEVQVGGRECRSERIRPGLYTTVSERQAGKSAQDMQENQVMALYCKMETGQGQVSAHGKGKQPGSTWLERYIGQARAHNEGEADGPDHTGKENQAAGGRQARVHRAGDRQLWPHRDGEAGNTCQDLQ